MSSYCSCIIPLPRLPDLLCQADGETGRLAKPANKRKLQQRGFGDQPINPTTRAHVRVAQPEFVVAFRRRVHQRFNAESLNEALQLTVGYCSFREVNEMRANPTLREKAERFAGVRAFLDPENLDFHLTVGRV